MHAPSEACPLASRLPPSKPRSIDVTTTSKKADAASAAFADAYAASGLCRQNQQAIQELLAAAQQDAPPSPKHGGVPHAAASAAAQLLKLGRSQGTATPWWWALATLLRYRSGGRPRRRAGHGGWRCS